MKRFFIIIGISIVSQVAMAQWRITATISSSGNCNNIGGGVHNAIAKAMVNDANSLPPFDSESLCRSYCNNLIREYSTTHDGCTTRVVATCHGLGGGSNGGINVLGVSQGTSFNSTNPVNEINDWSNDDMERMLALNPEYKNSSPIELSTGDFKADYSRNQLRKTATFTIDPETKFVPINMRKGGSSTIISEDLVIPKVIPANERIVSVYLDNINRDTAPLAVFADKYVMWIKEQFKIVSGHDIDEILKSIGKTKEQREILRNYREFEKRLLDEAKKKLDGYLSPIEHSKEKKEVDMAILALDSYGNDDKNYLLGTDYKRIRLEDIPLDDPIRILANKINSCNNTNLETGFNAVFYYNEKTNEYSLAFAGSALPTIHKSSELTLASKIAPSVDFDNTSKEYVVNALGLEVRIPQDIWSDWGKNNALQIAGCIASQYQMAKEIADVINSNPELKKLNINFIGHSLGGGVASVAGISTGKPTFTYNSEGISDKILESFGLLDKKNNHEYNITAYHTDNDVVTNTQKWAQGEGKKPIADAVQEEIGKGYIKLGFDQLKQLGYDTQAIDELSDVVLDDYGIDFNPIAKMIDPDNRENDIISTAVGDQVNLGDINTPSDKLISGGVGVVIGTTTFLRTGNIAETLKSRKTAANMTDSFLAHRMEPMVKTLILKNVVHQNLWQRFNKEKQSMDRESDNTKMRSLENTYIVIE